MKKIRVTKRQLGAYIRNLLKEGSGRSTAAEVIYDDNSNVNNTFIQLMYDATVSGTGTTGFGFVFEELLIKNASNFGLTSPKGLNISGDTNTEFADVIADGDVYYSVKSTFYERRLGQVNASKVSSLIKLALKLDISGALDTTGGTFDIKAGLIAGQVDAALTRKHSYLGLGMNIIILRPQAPNVRVKYLEDVTDSKGKTHKVYKAYKLNVDGTVATKVTPEVLSDTGDIEQPAVEEEITVDGAAYTIRSFAERYMDHQTLTSTSLPAGTSVLFHPLRVTANYEKTDSFTKEKIAEIIRDSGVKTAARQTTRMSTSDREKLKHYQSIAADDTESGKYTSVSGLKAGLRSTRNNPDVGQGKGSPSSYETLYDVTAPATIAVRQFRTEISQKTSRIDAQKGMVLADSAELLVSELTKRDEVTSDFLVDRENMISNLEVLLSQMELTDEEKARLGLTTDLTENFFRNLIDTGMGFVRGASQVATLLYRIFKKAIDLISEIPTTQMIDFLINKFRMTAENISSQTLNESHLYESILIDLMEASAKKQRAAQQPKKIKLRT